MPGRFSLLSSQPTAFYTSTISPSRPSKPSPLAGAVRSRSDGSKRPQTHQTLAPTLFKHTHMPFLAFPFLLLEIRTPNHHQQPSSRRLLLGSAADHLSPPLVASPLARAAAATALGLSRSATWLPRTPIGQRPRAARASPSGPGSARPRAAARSPPCPAPPARCPSISPRRRRRQPSGSRCRPPPAVVRAALSAVPGRRPRHLLFCSPPLSLTPSLSLSLRQGNRPHRRS